MASATVAGTSIQAEQHSADKSKRVYLPNKYGSKARVESCPECNRDMVIEVFNGELIVSCTHCHYWYRLGE